MTQNTDYRTQFPGAAKRTDWSSLAGSAGRAELVLMRPAQSLWYHFRVFYRSQISLSAEAANIPCMQTLSDILIIGDQAEDAGTPLVKNWPQVRGSLSLLDRVIGLEKVPVTNFSTMFPINFDELPSKLQRAFPSRRVYKIVQREIPRLLSVVGHVEDGWEALRVLTLLPTADVRPKRVQARCDRRLSLHKQHVPQPSSRRT